MNFIKIVSLTLLFSEVLFATQAFAQSATVNATGIVLEPMSISGSNLDFGEGILPGIAEVVARTDERAAQFTIVGEAGKEITATFTLPAAMTYGTNTMPLTFSATGGGHATADDQDLATEFDPTAVLTTKLRVTNGELYIWLGGTAEPAANQPAGAYSANITLETVYTGQ